MATSSWLYLARKQHSALVSRAQLLLERLSQSLVGYAKAEASSSDPFAAVLPWELTSAASLQVETRSCGELNVDFGRDLFAYAGLCHFPSALPASLLERCRTAADLYTSKVHQAVTAKGIDPFAVPGFRFHEACQRGPGRTDMRLLPHPLAPFDDELIHGDDAKWMPLVKECLGDDVKLLFQGLVVTDPGTEAQMLHSDGPHVPDQWREQDAETAAAVPHAQHPCHCLTVFVPLVDLTVENGATSFLPGTHHSVIATKALEAEASEAGSSSGAGTAAQLTLRAGDAILFDYRLFHAGGANASASRRPMMYLIYAKPWFRDKHNFPTREEASLFE